MITSSAVRYYRGSYLEVSVDDAARVHVFEAENHFTRVEAYLVLKERAVLREMIVKVTAVHQVQNEAQLVSRLKRVRHTHDERTTLLYTTVNDTCCKTL